MLFEIIDGRPSPAQWFRDIRSDDRLKYLGRFIAPARSTCYEFRHRMSKFIKKIHLELLKMAAQEGHLEPIKGVLDGTIVRGIGSRHKLLTDTAVHKRTEELEIVVANDCKQAGFQHPALPQWMGQTPLGRQRQLVRYRNSCKIIEQRLKDNLLRPKDKQLDPKHILVCPSEPEVQLSRDKEGVFGPVYNIQNLIDSKSQFILVSDVFSTATDARKAGLVLDQCRLDLNIQLEELWADAGYCSVFDIMDCNERGVELFSPFQENSFTAKKRSKQSGEKITREQFQFHADKNSFQCPGGHTAHHSGQESVWRSGNTFTTSHRYTVSAEHCQGCPLKEQCLSPKAKSRILTRIEGSELLEAMKEKMATPEGKARSQSRGQIAERTFADTKQHRGGRRMHGYGLERAKVENLLNVLAQNLLTLHRKRKAETNPNERQGP